MLTAKDIMSVDVVTAAPDMPVEELAALFYEKKISGVPVVAAGQLLGVVTENDLIDQTKNLHIPTVVTILDSVFVLGNTDKMDKEFQKMIGRTVRDIFSDKLVTVSTTTPVNEIATLMAGKRVHTLPVVENGKLLGVVGKADLIKAIAS